MSSQSSRKPKTKTKRRSPTRSAKKIQDGVRVIELLPAQLELLRDKETFDILGVAGFGSGKTLGGCFKLLDLARQNIGYRSLFTEPVYPMIKDLLIPKIKLAAELTGIPYNFTKSPNPEFEFFFRTGSHLCMLRSGENFDRLFGTDIAFAILDEIDKMSEEDAKGLHTAAVSRIRTGKVNQLISLTTPEGFQFAYHHYVKDNQDGARKVIRSSTYDNVFLPKTYIQNLLKNIPANRHEAYLNGHFVNMFSGLVYPEFDEKKNASTLTPEYAKQRGLPLEIGMDFNVNGMSGIANIRDEKGDPHAIWEFINHRGTPQIIDAIKEKFSWCRDSQGGWNITVYPDCAGKFGKSSNPDETDIDLLEDAGLTCDYPDSHDRVRKRVNCMNMMFLNANGIRRQFINAYLCHRLVDCLKQQCFKNGEPEKGRGKHDLSGPIDAQGYYITRAFGMGDEKTLIDPFG